MMRAAPDTAVGWRALLRLYGALLLLTGIFVGGFLWAGSHSGGNPITPDILRFRAFGFAALLLSTCFAASFALGRLHPSLPAASAYRAHIGWAAFAAALTHAVLVLNWYHDIGALNPLVALLADNTRFGSLTGFPYELLGVAALLLLPVAAASAQPAWRQVLSPRILSPRTRRALEAAGAVGFALVILHVALGPMLSERSSVYAALLIAIVAVLLLEWSAVRRPRLDTLTGAALRATRWAGLALAAALCVSMGLSLALGWTQRDPGPGGWGAGDVYISGVLEGRPFPLIRVSARSDNQPGRTVLLVSEGKFGAAEAAASLDGRPVEAHGYALSRGNVTVLQLAEEANELHAAPGPASPSQPPVSLGCRRLRGEIVDAKCFIGAMKPGDGKAHKECGALCLLGGVPALFLTRDASGAETLFLLAEADGGPAGAWARDYVGEPVEIDAELERSGDLNIARVAPASVHSLAW